MRLPRPHRFGSPGDRALLTTAAVLFAVGLIASAVSSYVEALLNTLALLLAVGSVVGVLGWLAVGELLRPHRVRHRRDRRTCMRRVDPDTGEPWTPPRRTRTDTPREEDHHG